MDSHLSVFSISAFSFVVAQASKPLDQYGGCFSDEGCAGHQTQSSKPSEIALGGDAHLCTIILTHNTNTERGRQSCVYILVHRGTVEIKSTGTWHRTSFRNTNLKLSGFLAEPPASSSREDKLQTCRCDL